MNFLIKKNKSEPKLVKKNVIDREFSSVGMDNA